jgi:pimeloyl-ACP methyl ester carboxylesterase
MRRLLSGALLIGFAVSVSAQPAPAIQFATVGQAVRLEVIDWGGKGKTLVFLSGMGNTAHVYDTFAPQFTDRFHVIGITRRGFGASSRPQQGYTVPQFADDIIAVIDELRLERPILIGHSIAGEELSFIGAHAPDRIGGLIYFDAAYDRVDPTFAALLKSWPNAPMQPSKGDLASRSSYQAFFQRTHRWHYPDSELDQYDQFGDGAPEVVTAILNAVVPPDYRKITAPALAFYSMPRSVGDLFPTYQQTTASARPALDRFWPKYAAAAKDQHRRFVREVRGAQGIDVNGATHYLFLDWNAHRVAADMRRFLNGLASTR